MFDPEALPRTEEELDRLPRMHPAASTAVSGLRRMLNTKTDLNTLPDPLLSAASIGDRTLFEEVSLPPDSESFRLIPVIWDPNIELTIR
jgi:hypothetical protein